MILQDNATFISGDFILLQCFSYEKTLRAVKISLYSYHGQIFYNNDILCYVHLKYGVEDDAMQRISFETAIKNKQGNFLLIIYTISTGVFIICYSKYVNDVINLF